MSDRTRLLKASIHDLKSSSVTENEKLIAEINELAEVLCDEMGDEEIFFRDTAFLEQYKDIFEHGECDCAPYNLSRIKLLSSFETLGLKAFLCMRICDILGIKGIKSLGTFFDGCESGEGGSISYVKNPYADRAYLSFADNYENAFAHYSVDFNQACEDVYYERSDYCILPVYTSAGGRISSVAWLSTKYELKTACLCEIDLSEGESTVFALMKKEMELPKGSDGVYFEVGINDRSKANDILCVSKYCGLDAHDVNITSAGASLVFKAGDDGICGFISYLCLEHPDFVPKGIYFKV